MTKQTQSSSAARRTLLTLGATQGRIALVGVALAALIAAVTVGIWSAFVSAAPQPVATSAMTATVSSTPAPTSSAEAILPVISFKSNSGNLRCAIGKFSGEAAAICQQINVNYAAPWGSCVLDEYQVGLYAGVRASGPYWPCVNFWPEPADVLAYDTPITQNGITCVINLDTGVRCTNESGNGFTMEYDAGITHF